MEENKMFCKHCGEQIDADCIICPKCGKQVGTIAQAQPQIVINNSNQNVNTNTGYAMGVKPKNKWVALLLCFFLGCLGAHKFYEGKILLGILYLFTLGFMGVGVLIDFIILLFKPNPYF